MRRTSNPSIETEPESTSYSRGIRYVEVVLPPPDGPTRATSWPGAAVYEMSVRAKGMTRLGTARPSDSATTISSVTSSWPSATG